MTDLTMPDMKGDELADNIRKTRADIPIILSSGYDKDEVGENRSDLIYLPKPYNLVNVSKVISDNINRSE